MKTLLLLTILLIQMGFCQIWQNFTSNVLIVTDDNFSRNTAVYMKIKTNEDYECPQVVFTDELGNINITTAFVSKDAVQCKLILSMMIMYLEYINKVHIVRDENGEISNENYRISTAFSYESLGWMGFITRTDKDYIYAIRIDDYILYMQLGNLRWIYNRI